MSNANTYDASPSLLGYLYQVRYALLIAIEKLSQVDDIDDCFVSIETLDDIAFEKNGSPIELLQAKYHTKKGNLTDRSPDLWKTIRIWSEMIQNRSKSFDLAIFTLLTTERTKKDSIASYLSIDKSYRDIDKALNMMQKISLEENQTNIKSYQTFLSLNEQQQKILLNSIYIIPDSPTILDVEKRIKNNLRLSTADRYLGAFYSRFEGWWLKRVIDILSSDEESAISLVEVDGALENIRDMFLPGNLPSDYDDVEPKDIDIDNDTRTFVEQLRLIGATNRVIRNAIIDYYKAYEQRSRWSRDGLLKPGEIGKYMKKLQDAWEHYAAILEMQKSNLNDEEKKSFGLNLYSHCQLNEAIPIRNNFSSSYVSNGTYHELSDLKEIGWHPDFKDLLSSNDDKVA